MIYRYTMSCEYSVNNREGRCRRFGDSMEHSGEAAKIDTSFDPCLWQRRLQNRI